MLPHSSLMNQTRTLNFVFQKKKKKKKTGVAYFFAWYFSPPSRYFSALWAVGISVWKCINITAAKNPCKFAFYTCSNMKEWLIAYKNKVLVDAILSNDMIDVWFAPFPGISMSGFLSHPPPPFPPFPWSEIAVTLKSKEFGEWNIVICQILKRNIKYVYM